MSIRFEDVTRDNFMACIRLQPREDQRHFVAPNAVSLAESKFYPELVPQAIYARDTLVGFLMWAPEEPDDEPGTIWLVRLMIDARYQGNGYGGAAMEAFIAQARANPQAAQILLSVEPDNAGAEALYTGVGFQRTGAIQEGEVVVRLALRDQ